MCKDLRIAPTLPSSVDTDSGNQKEFFSPFSCFLLSPHRLSLLSQIPPVKTKMTEYFNWMSRCETENRVYINACVLIVIKKNNPKYTESNESFKQIVFFHVYIVQMK